VGRTKGERAPTYDLPELQEKYPSLRTLAGPPSKACEQAWIAAFTTKPEAMEGMLSDLIKQAYAKPGRIGQRPMPREEEVNLNVLIHGEYCEDPLHVVLPTLVKISERAFCMKTNMNRRTYQRMLLPPDDRMCHHPDMYTLEQIAKAVDKPPSFFMEYRMMAAQAAFVSLIMNRPGIATRLYRDHLTTYKQSPFLRPGA
jgi:hypothetical protein